MDMPQINYARIELNKVSELEEQIFFAYQNKLITKEEYELAKQIIKKIRSKMNLKKIINRLES